MKKYYEVHMMQHVTGSVVDDYETVWYECDCGCTYHECKRVAKEFSKHYGDVNVPKCPYKFNERKTDEIHHQGLDAGLAMVKIVRYTKTDVSEYEPLYYEYYQDGRVIDKYEFDL